MMDEFENLKAALTAATPRPDAEKRAENIAHAMKNFDRAQESRAGARQNSGFLKNGVQTMINILSSRGALTASTALVALGLVVVLPLDRVSVPKSSGPGAIPEAVVPSDAEADSLAQSRGPEIVEQGIANSANRGESVALEELTVADEAVGLAAPRTRLAVEPAPAVLLPESNSETFANADPNPLKITHDDPVSTFSIDVDTASYSVVRNSLTRGMLPPAEAVRVEEMINYFPYDYATPDGDLPFQTTASLGQTPWNPDTQLLHVAIQGAPVVERPPLNLVFLIDTSGSMADSNKLPLLLQSLRMLLNELDPRDEISIVTYAGSAGEVLAPTRVMEKDKILTALTNLDAGGSTAGQAGLQQAYATAASMSAEGEVTRVILATDGDFNVGISDPEALEDFIAQKRDDGVYLSVLGFGRGNLDDATMQALAQNGNGQAAYIDTLSEARKSLVDQMEGALFPIADDVKIQIEFNPAQIAEYRLIGYETRALSRTDFSDDRVDAGEIGAGHSVTAIYELTPVGSPAQLSDPLRYENAETITTIDELGFLRLRYKNPGEDQSQLIEMPLTELPQPDSEAQFAAAIAGFGQLLSGRDLGEWGYFQAHDLAAASRGEDPFGYRSEALGLIRLADSLSQ